MTESAIFAIFAKPVSANTNRIIILSDSAYAGFTGALIGYISNDALNALRSAIFNTPTRRWHGFISQCTEFLSDKVTQLVSNAYT